MIAKISAKGVLFITIEDETGIANLVVWPQVFGTFRRIVLGSGMIAAQGRVQREGEVVHLVVHRLTDLSPEFAQVGARDAPFPLVHGRSDGVTHGSTTPDPRDIYIPLFRTRHKGIYPVPETMPSITPKPRTFR
ncbi:OB-fold nucleic acid binding domain-containing protein [Marinivivus vitaminiproducens]|uniref:OB-fold nucleic acid binding domain-containing protein n=1 Tax=Marinivivus vitaminiproducens TaxID=3035935 RepID=UPI00279D286F|nr:OB-fold nucleic acid binding domain-containing protein [Geminicoccaceae bacterium SCSIO 64248]